MRNQWSDGPFKSCSSLQNFSFVDLSLFVPKDFKDTPFSLEGINEKK
jgi:hypothetical protein